MWHLKYLSEINAFYDWLESNSMAPSAIALWHALMATANKARWPMDFSVAISTLRSKTGASRDAIYVARNQLKQKGRIDYRERKGNQSAVYRIISFESVYTTQTPTQTPTQSPTQTPTINRQDKIRQDILSSVRPSKENEDGLTELLACIFGDKNIPSIWTDTIWETITEMYTAPDIVVRGASISQEKVRERLRGLSGESIKWAVEKMVGAGDVKVPKAYLMSCLYNAPAEYDLEISLQVQRDSLDVGNSRGHPGD